MFLCISHSHLQTVFSSFLFPGLPFLCSLEAFLMWLTVWKDQLKMYLPIDIIFAQREQVKLLSRPKKCHFHSPLYLFWLTMTSQTESLRSAWYTPLYQNKLFERKSSQWRLLWRWLWLWLWLWPSPSPSPSTWLLLWLWRWLWWWWCRNQSQS